MESGWGHNSYREALEKTQLIQKGAPLSSEPPYQRGDRVRVKVNCSTVSGRVMSFREGRVSTFLPNGTFNPTVLVSFGTGLQEFQMSSLELVKKLESVNSPN